MEYQRLIGFILILIGMGIIIILFLVLFPNQMEVAKNYLIILFPYTRTYPLPDPIRELVTVFLYVATFQSFQQIENSSIFIYIGVSLGIFGAILMFFEGVSLELIEESEEDSKFKN